MSIQHEARVRNARTCANHRLRSEKVALLKTPQKSPSRWQCLLTCSLLTCPHASQHMSAPKSSPGAVASLCAGARLKTPGLISKAFFSSSSAWLSLANDGQLWHELMQLPLLPARPLGALMTGAQLRSATGHSIKRTSATRPVGAMGLAEGESWQQSETQMRSVPSWFNDHPLLNDFFICAF